MLRRGGTPPSSSCLMWLMIQPIWKVSHPTAPRSTPHTCPLCPCSMLKNTNATDAGVSRSQCIFPARDVLVDAAEMLTQGIKISTLLVAFCPIRDWEMQNRVLSCVTCRPLTTQPSLHGQDSSFKPVFSSSFRCKPGVRTGGGGLESAQGAAFFGPGRTL